MTSLNDSVLDSCTDGHSMEF